MPHFLSIEALHLTRKYGGKLNLIQEKHSTTQKLTPYATMHDAIRSCGNTLLNGLYNGQGYWFKS